MRSDMRHVLIDRPRVGGDNEKQHRLYKDLEDAPSHEGMAQRYGERKAFSDHIRPLQRFLHKNVGRPWDKVYSEIREQVGPNSTMDLHLIEHVQREVETTVVIDGKVVYVPTSKYPITSGKYNNFYVHPRTGILCLAPRKTRATPRRDPTLVVDPGNPRVQYRQVQRPSGAIWEAFILDDRIVESVVNRYDWRGRVVIGTEPVYGGYDVFLKRYVKYVTRGDSAYYYGDENLYAKERRGVTTAELKMIKTALAA